MADPALEFLADANARTKRVHAGIADQRIVTIIAKKHLHIASTSDQTIIAVIAE
jgi:hypothetical protein